MELTVKELASMIRNRQEIPKNIKIVNGSITVSEGSNIELFNNQVSEQWRYILTII